LPNKDKTHSSGRLEIKQIGLVILLILLIKLVSSIILATIIPMDDKAIILNRY
jgi:Na+-transporting NADH:ubiquinone oxidoreductase subunit NqrC